MAAVVAAVLAENLRFTAGRRHQPEQDFQRRTLARTVGAEEPVDLALGDLDVEILDGLDSLSPHGDRENLVQSFDADGWYAHD